MFRKITFMLSLSAICVVALAQSAQASCICTPAHELWYSNHRVNTINGHYQLNYWDKKMKRDGQVQAPQWGALDQAKYDIVTAAKANAKRTLTQFKQKYDSIKCGRVCKAVKNCFKYGFVTYADEIASGHSEKTAEYAAIHACLLATFTTLVFGSDGPRQTTRGGGTSGPIAINRRRFGLAAPALRALAFA